MEVSWRRINNYTRDIIQEFEKLYTYDRNWVECEKLITDIFNVYSAKYNIQLDKNADFDHIFQQLFEGMKKVIEEYTPTDLNDQTEAKKIDKFFEKMSDDILKTAEIRGRLKEIDPSNLEFRKALEQGIVDARERQNQINVEIGNLDNIYNEMFGTEIPNLRVITDAELADLGHFDIIENKLKEIETLKTAIASMKPGIDDADIAINQDRINVLETDIQEKKDRIRNTNLVDETRLNSINISDITNSLIEVTSLKNELDTKTTIDFGILQNNLKEVYDKYPNIYSLASIDFAKMAPDTKDGRMVIHDEYLPFVNIYETLKTDLKIYDKEISIYEDQIHQIDEEEKILETEAPSKEEIINTMPADIERKLTEDRAYYTKMVNAQMFGDKDYHTAYEQCLNLFKREIKEKEFVLRNEDGTEILADDGTPKKGKYKTVDYDTLKLALEKDTWKNNPIISDFSRKIGIKNVEDLLKFLQLEEYKDKLERDTKIVAGDKLALTEYQNYSVWKNAGTPEEKESAKNALYAEKERDAVYLKTFHYSTNDYEFKRQYHQTAGKVGETYLPLEKYSRDKSLGQNLRVAGHNLYAYSKWQNPFKAGSFLKGCGVTLLNAGNLVTMLPRMLTKATGNTISKFYDENTDPNPYNGRNDARRGARIEYYKEQGDSNFKARLKGWMDELPFSKRETRVEKDIVDRQVDEVMKSVKASYIAGAIESVTTDLERQKANIRRNRELRSADAKIMAGTWEVQGDIIRDIEGVNDKTLRQRVMQRVALEYSDVDSSYISNTGSRNPAENSRRNTQFIKEKEELQGKRSIVKPVILPLETKWGRKSGAAIAADPIGRAIRSNEIKNTLTRWYTAEEMLLLKGQNALMKWGIGKIKDTTLETYQEQVDTGETKRVEIGTKQIENGGHWEYPTTVEYRDGNFVQNLSMEDLEYSGSAHFEHTANPNFNQVSWIEEPVAENTQAMCLDFRIPEGLATEEYESLAKLGYEVGDRINYSIADGATKNLCLATGKTYATEYIDGLFNFSGETNILDAIEQYFPEEVDQAFNIILESENYGGEAGMKFFTDSFSTSHGIESIMEKMNSWGTGWGIESVSEQAKVAATETVEVVKQIAEDPVWVKDFVTEVMYDDVPVYELIDKMKEVPDEAKKALKERLLKINNGLTVLGVGNSVNDLVRPTTSKEPGREIYKGNDIEQER